MALTDKLTAIGNAIREKSGTTELIPLADMPQAILDIVSGSGTEYTNIVYNDDDTITLIGTDDTEHTIACVYEDDKLVSVTYDGKAIKLGYEGGELKSIGKTAVDLSDAKISASAKNIEAVGLFANDIIVPTVTITSELKDNSIKVVGLSVIDKE